MFTPRRAMTQAASSPALPRVRELQPLYDLKFIPRMGQMTMIAGFPGSMKSTLAMWWISNMEGVDALVFSADMNSHTFITRYVAERTKTDIDSVVADFEQGLESLYFEDLPEPAVTVVFDSSPTLEDIADSLSAYVEVYDKYPAVVVVDNLLNVEAGTEEDFSGMRLIVKELHRMTRETGSALFLLHHVREEGDLTVPAPRDKIAGKVSQIPERVLSIAYDPFENCLKISPVKNRDGQQDPTGKTFIRLKAEPATASFRKWNGVGL